MTCRHAAATCSICELEHRRAVEAVHLARTVIDKYGTDADKPSVHLAKAVLTGAAERDALRAEVAHVRDYSKEVNSDKSALLRERNLHLAELAQLTDLVTTLRAGLREACEIAAGGALRSPLDHQLGIKDRVAELTKMADEPNKLP